MTAPQGPFRNYLYISDTKVESYLGQMGKEKRSTLAVELGIDLKILRAGVKREQESQENRVTRLEAVEKSIRNNEPVGALSSEERWISDSATAFGATFRDQPRNVDLMFYFAADQDHFLGLAGSAHHIVGATRPSESDSSVSHLPDLLQALEEVADGEVKIPRADTPYETIAHHLKGGVALFPGEQTKWPGLMAELSNRLSNRPRQRISFLARRLTSSDIDGRRFTLATPLYISE